jgi:hypothetical protein
MRAWTPKLAVLGQGDTFSKVSVFARVIRMTG